MEPTNEYTDELIALQLAGEADEQQQEELKNWINADANNAHYYEQMRSIFENSAKARNTQEFDSDQAWKNIQHAMHDQTVSGSKIRSLFIKYDFLKVAAGFLLLVSLTYFINTYYGNNNKQISFISQEKSLQKSLADGSVIHLNKKSQIKYDNEFNKKNRKISLEGEAFFDVKHDDKLPFTILVGDLLIEDVGTSFNVKAYPDADKIEVAVASGEVKFYSAVNKGIALKAGEMGTYNKRTKAFSTAPIPDKNYAPYRDKIFVFENTELHTVVAMLNDVYQSNIQFNESKLGKCRLSVSFENERLDRIIEVIAATFNLKVTKTEKAILLEGESCEK